MSNPIIPSFFFAHTLTTTTFIHTADWQLGKPYAQIEDGQKRALVRHERLASIQRLGQAVRETQSAFVLIAGDLFDSTTPDRGTVSSACAAIGELSVPVYVIPGNHDHGGPGSVWEQTFFQREHAALAPNLHLLLKAEPVELPGAILLPCPLLRRHESADTAAWMRSLDWAVLGDKPRIVLAHGSVQEFSARNDEEEDNQASNLLQLARLPLSEIDYAALGDWHGMKDVSVSADGGRLCAWYSGTPETDRFPRGETNLPGHALSVTVCRGQAPEVRPLKLGRLGWHDLTFFLDDDASVQRMEENMAARFQGRTGQDLLRLTVHGSLGMAALAHLDCLLETWSSRLLRLRVHRQVTPAPTQEEMDALISRPDAPLLSRVASQLMEDMRSHNTATTETARLALQLLHAETLM